MKSTTKQRRVNGVPIQMVLISWAAALLFALATAAFSPPATLLARPERRMSMYIGDGSDKDDGSGTSDSASSSVMSSNRLAHVMLRVPSVQETVDYWVAKGATITQQNKSEKTETETAFVCLGNSKNTDDVSRCFSLEITSLPPGEELDVGNSLCYIGTSMLLDFKNNLIGAITGEKKGGDDSASGDMLEPNGIDVRRVASGPGDYFARLCLRPKPIGAKGEEESVNGEATKGKSPLEVTEEFYTKLLGMRVVANDSDLLCLRYNQNSADGAADGDGSGVATTLVFSTEGQTAEEELIMGNMLDHIVVSTKSVDEAADVLKATDEGSSAIFMEPKNMFGTKIMGIRDPNGYQIYLAEMETEGR